MKHFEEIHAKLIELKREYKEKTKDTKIETFGSVALMEQIKLLEWVLNIKKSCGT
jgi:hypothetical protein